ncbi:CLAVATA3/ESR (CLE)-related protein 45 [Spatholobus suberectus]|nr:CLAVATA3/ESR (CLE)-related protein 45 [Spatholobus suberectus]
MVFHPSRTISLLVFVGFLISIQPENVLGLRSFEIALRQSQKDQRILLQNQHTSKVTEKEVLNTKKNSANANNGLDPTKKNSANVVNEFDPNPSSKRRVPRGSDPIHNRT